MSALAGELAQSIQIPLRGTARRLDSLLTPLLLSEAVVRLVGEEMQMLKIYRVGERATKMAPDDRFTGAVHQDEVLVGAAPSRMRATNVTFSPGARTAWHRHPVGQTLWAVSGVGRVQVEGGPVEELRPGDTAVIPPGARHWHGAAPDSIFAHLAMSETGEDGAGTDWFEKVNDSDYLG